jgi:hypothetical protein
MRYKQRKIENERVKEQLFLEHPLKAKKYTGHLYRFSGMFA